MGFLKRRLYGHWIMFRARYAFSRHAKRRGRLRSLWFAASGGKLPSVRMRFAADGEHAHVYRVEWESIKAAFDPPADGDANRG